MLTALLSARMLNGIYQNATSMSGLEKWNNAIAQNIAQSSIPGYKKAQVTFEGKEQGMVGYQAGFDKTLYQAQIASTPKGDIDFSEGSMRVTGNPLEFAIDGEGFFELRKEDGNYVYTRDGEFHFNNLGELVSKQGYHVMSAERQAIQSIPDGGDFNVGENGAITQNGQELGLMGLRKLEDPSVLKRAHGGFMIPEGGDEEAVLGEVKVRQGVLESSNVSTTNEMVNMISVSRAFELNQRVIRARDDLLTKAIQSLGGR